MTTAVFTGCSRKVEDVELPSKPETVTSAEPSNSEPPVTTSKPPITTSEPITSVPVTASEPITTSEPVDPEDPYEPEPEPEPAVEPTTSDPNCPPGFVSRTNVAGTTFYYDPNEPGYSGGVGKFQFVGRLSADGSGNVLGFQGRAPGNLGTEVIPYYVYQYGDYIINFDGIEMPVPDDQVGSVDSSGSRRAVRAAYNHAHDDYITPGNISEEDVDKIFGW